MTTAQKAAFSQELEQWIQQNSGYTKNALTDWIKQKLLERHYQLAAALFVEFVWEGLHGSSSLSVRCGVVADEFADQAVPSEES